MSRLTTECLQLHDQRLASGVTTDAGCPLPGRRTDLPPGWRMGKLNSRIGRDKRRLPPPPLNNVMFHESRYKTELCRQFEELGDCEYGERCLFAHGMDELKNIPHRHPKFKTEKCSAYFENGFCSFGPRCSFIHEKPDAVKILMQLQQSVRQQQEQQQETEHRPESVMDRLMHEAALLPGADCSPRLPVFTQIAP